MDKSHPNSTYMPIAAGSIGYRNNNARLIEFFKANPTADFRNARTVEQRVTIAADRAIDATGDTAAYTAANDRVYAVADAVSGATYSDFIHYALELQEAYKAAVAQRYVRF